MAVTDLGKYKRKALVISGLGSFMATLDSSIVNVSLPTISRELNASIDMVGWIILAYTLAVISLLLYFGALSEKKGFQFSYRYGFLIFMLGSMSCGLSQEIYMLIFSRVVQGVGAAMMMSVGPALITRSFPDNERGRGLSVISMVVSGGLMLGPPLGGFIIGLAGWRWIFFVNVPVSIIGAILTGRFIGDFPITNPDRKIPIPGAVTQAIGLVAMMIAIMLYGKNIINLGTALGILALAIASLGLFIFFESRPRTRLIGLDLFNNRVFAFSLLAMFFVFVSLSSVTVLMPFFLERIKELKPEHVGLFLMVIPVFNLPAAPLAGYLADKVQARIVASAGVGIMLVGVYFIRNLTAETSSFEIIRVLAILGFGVGTFMTPNTSSVMGSVVRKRLGIASGMIATTRSLGITFGVSVAVAVFEFFRSTMSQRGGGRVESFIFGYHSVYDIVIFIVAGAIVLSLIRGKNLRNKDETNIMG
jgi:EmrB/QacA subfamily drug resistance transporter